MRHYLAEPQFRIGSALQATLDQRSPSRPRLRVRRGSEERGERMLKDRVGRQCDFVHESLGADQRMLFEGGEAVCESIHERFDVLVGQRSIDVAVTLGEIGRKIVGSEDHLQPASAAHQPCKPRHGVSTGHRAHADFELA